MSIQLFKPTFDVDGCLEEIKECLVKGWTGMGYKTIEFEEQWKDYTGLQNAHFLNSATAGLNLAFEIFKDVYEWEENAEIITTSMTFVSSNHAILLSKLNVVFADIDESLCLDPEDVKKKINSNTKAILFVGMGGNPGKYQEIVELCKEHDIKLILDAAHMAGTRINGEIPGKEADAVIYSFQAVKNLPTADSGMICFKDKQLDEIVRKRAWLGINKDTYLRSGSKGNYKWKYDVEYVGNKYHGNSIMAAIGIVQLKHLDDDNKYRQQISEWYTEGFRDHSSKIKLVELSDNVESSRHLFQIIVDDRDGLLEALNKVDIFPGVHYIDNTMYKMYHFAKGQCPVSEYVSDHILSLPIHLQLTKEDVLRVIKEVVNFVEA